ncbi:hypothetical protein Focb16_v004624 [Fusarium oxysporum f. sp. cubense]|uniref:Uncharacterized protein n=1 Tax=Fusarium oxysporum f. sp. cubense TaxID=61366 RepID=A0A559LJN2_FUSOC|nr:hypothetical protein Focb16_v004624 [Fusarium oxysporum f. sp. cubense]
MASVRTEFHTHHAAPRRLLEELRDLLGPSAQFSVDMRHNIYEIETTEEFDVDTLYQRCKQVKPKKQLFLAN